MTTNWYVAQVLPQLRKVAELNLGWQNFRFFSPEYVSRQRKSGKVVRTGPLFKGYTFVQFDIDTQRWTSINYTRGVIRLLPKASMIPKPVSTQFVEYLIEHSPVGADEFNELLQEFMPGAQVRVTHGVLQGYIGQVVVKRGKFFEVMFDSMFDVNLRNPLILAEHLSLL